MSYCGNSEPGPCYCFLASGNYITASFTLENGGSKQQGVIFFEFNMQEKKIQRVRFYVEE